jgi:hypothetical protein
MRAEMVIRKVRRRFYYSVPEYGRKYFDLGRTQSYEHVPKVVDIVRDGKLMLVPKGRGDRRARELLGKRAKRKADG